GFTLVNAIMIPITAFFIDRFSIRWLFAVAMGIFAVGSAMAGWGANFGVLIVGRLVQAAGAGILMPMVMTVLMWTFPVERRGSAMGLFGIVIAFAPAIGPTVAGVIVDNASWHILFFAVAALALLIAIIAVFLIDNKEDANKHATLDILSVVLSTIGFGALLYGLSAIGSDGVSVIAFVAIAVGAVGIVLFFFRQLRLDEPMLQVRVLKNRKFLIGTIVCMLVQGSLMVGSILMPIYLQTLMGYSATITGLVMMPGAIITGIMSPIAGRLFDRYGPRMLSLIGLSLLCLVTLGFAFLGKGTPLAYIIVVYSFRMFSITLVNMPITTWGMNALDTKLINHGTSVNNTLRQVAGSMGTAIIVSIYSIAVGVNTASMGEIDASFTGINVAFGASLVFTVAGLILAIIFVRNDRSSDQKANDPEGVRRSATEEIMENEVYSLPADAQVHDAAQLFVDKGVSAAPLVDEDDEVVGIVSDGDILRCLEKKTTTVEDPIAMMTYNIESGSSNREFDEKLEDVMNAPVRSIATPQVISVDVHTDLTEICRVMGENRLKKIPVTDEDKITGVINRSNIIRYALEHYLEGHEEGGDEPKLEEGSD
ncbi:MAG: MDR family MFS transporter, partial [Coriobacteriaceae bacterium]|nr:MDR family MFS transporter [Coriobacteriaceae bacterium]